MASVYPGSLDSLATNKGDATDETSGSPTGGTAGDHAAHHNNLADAINKIEAELGTDPSGAAATVAAALAAKVDTGDSRLSDQRTPLDGSVTLAKAASSLLAEIEYAYSTYKRVVVGAGYGNPNATGTWVWLPSTSLIAQGSSAAALGEFGFDPASYSAGTRTVKLRLRATVKTNAVAPGASVTVTVGLFPTTQAAAVSGSHASLTLGTVVTGSQPTAQGPLTANSSTDFDSGDFTAPSAGKYAIGVVVGGAAFASGATCVVGARLDVRQV